MRITALNSSITTARNRITNIFTLPERFKGTFVEKWVKYWNGLILDYSEVAVGLVKDARAKPKSTALKCCAAYATYLCYKNNPDMENFMLRFRHWTNNMLLVDKTLQNAKSAEYLVRLERDLNQNKLQLFSLGLFAILWEDLYDKDECTYPAVCKYTKVSMWNFHERIVDIGFWNRFWRLEYNMRNFDINYI